MWVMRGMIAVRRNLVLVLLLVQPSAYASTGGSALQSITTSSSCGSYRADEPIDITLHFDRPLTLRGGYLLLDLNIGRRKASVRIAPFVQARTATGIYTVHKGDTANALRVTKVSRTSGVLVDRFGNEVVLLIPQLHNLEGCGGIRIDTTPPRILSARKVSGKNTIAVTFSENVFGNRKASGNISASSFVLTATDGSASVQPSPQIIKGQGTTCLLGVSPVGIPDGAETLYLKPSGSCSIYDGAGNPLSKETVFFASGIALPKFFLANRIEELCARRPPLDSPLSGPVGNMVAGKLSALKTRTDVNGSTPQPAGEDMLPTVPLSLADGAITATLAPDGTAVSYSGERQRVNLNLGMGYYHRAGGGGELIGTTEASSMIGNHLAVGTRALIYRSRRDVLFNTVWQIPDSGLRLKASGDYMWGNQEFNFPSGLAELDLEQYGWALSAKWIIPESEECSSLHSLGVSLWGARANQTSHAEPVYYMDETDTAYQIWRDPRLLAEGRLKGASADIQVALLPNVVSRGSVGYEELVFPFFDGSREVNSSMYSNFEFFWEPFKSLT